MAFRASGPATHTNGPINAAEPEETPLVAKNRLARERKTMACMVRLYCRAHHRPPEDLCAECAELLEYALARLDTCPLGDGKTTCAKCPVHCYRRTMRERTRAVMRYAGPRMLWHHPLLTLQHFWDGRRRAPVEKPR